MFLLLLFIIYFINYFIIYFINDFIIYFINGSTADASDWMFVRINSLGDRLRIIENKADGAATFYDTNQLRDFGGFTDPGFDLSTTIIMLKGSSQTFSSIAAYTIDVYGANDGDTLTLNGKNYSYSANTYRDPFNVNVLKNISAPPPSPGPTIINDNEVNLKAIITCGNISCATTPIT